MRGRSPGVRHEQLKRVPLPVADAPPAAQTHDPQHALLVIGHGGRALKLHGEIAILDEDGDEKVMLLCVEDGCVAFACAQGQRHAGYVPEDVAVPSEGQNCAVVQEGCVGVTWERRTCGPNCLEISSISVKPIS